MDSNKATKRSYVNIIKPSKLILLHTVPMMCRCVWPFFREVVPRDLRNIPLFWNSWNCLSCLWNCLPCKFHGVVFLVCEYWNNPIVFVEKSQGSSRYRGRRWCSHVWGECVVRQGYNHLSPVTQRESRTDGQCIYPGGDERWRWRREPD